MKTLKILIVSLLALNLILFALCQDQENPETPEAPKAPTNLIIDEIGTITTQPTTVEIPEDLAVPKGHTFSFLLYASGKIIYECAAVPGQSSLWKNTGIDASLINDKSTQRFDPSFKVVQHSMVEPPINGGNFTWDALIKNDTSKIIAKSVATASQGDTKLPWELYVVTQRDDVGRFSTMSYVLRVNTNGGVPPPASECGVNYRDKQPYNSQYDAEYWYFEGPLPGSEPAPPNTTSEASSDGYSAKTLHNQTPLSLMSIGPGQLGWVAIIGFVSVSVIFF